MKKKLAIVILTFLVVLTFLTACVSITKKGVFETALPTAQLGEYAKETVTAKPLVILMDFPNYKYTDLDTKENFRVNKFKGEETTPDFYKSLFFGDDFYETSDGIKYLTANKFFFEESGGAYSMDGDVYGWYTAKNNIEYYGTNYDENNEDVQTVRAAALVEEGIRAFVKNNPDVDLSQYDVEDKWDIDNDDNFDEPDGILDCVILIHAGLGEEFDGGSIGEKAIWPHRYGFNWIYTDDDESDTTACKPQIGRKMLITKNLQGKYTGSHEFKDANNKQWFAEDYILLEQDLPMDGFIHEYGHVLGLPDLYCLNENSNMLMGYWSLMCGCYAGKPSGSLIGSYGAWCKKFLQEDALLRNRNYAQWQNSVKCNLDDIFNGVDITLDQSSMVGKNNDSFIIELPDVEDSAVTQVFGNLAYFTGTGKDTENYMNVKNAIDLSTAESPKLVFDAWWNLNSLSDFVSVQVKEKSGGRWVTLKDETGFATDKVEKWIEENLDDDDILYINPGWGISDTSGGEWKNVVFDLSEFKGKKITLRFRLKTYSTMEPIGMYIDNIIIKDGENIMLSDDVEKDLKFRFEGFSADTGMEKPYSHYYIGEWRNPNNKTMVDKCLPSVNVRGRNIKYDSGLVLCYVNEKYYKNDIYDQENSLHPGEVFAGIIDADINPARYEFLDNERNELETSRAQLHDAAFSLRNTSEFKDKFMYKGEHFTAIDDSSNMAPVFDDSIDRFYDERYGLKNPNYGIQVFVVEESKDRSSAKIHIGTNKGMRVVQENELVKSVKFADGKVIVTPTQKFADTAYISIVATNMQTERINLTYSDGVYVGDIKDLNGKELSVEFIVMNDKDGNVKSLYNSRINKAFGADFNELMEK
ncbi:MAG: immune inhibitor A [Oscillospiraceae bacterium]